MFQVLAEIAIVSGMCCQIGAYPESEMNPTVGEHFSCDANFSACSH